MSSYYDSRGKRRVKIHDFKKSRRRTSDTVREHSWVAVECNVFEQDGVWTDLQYRPILDEFYGRRRNFILGEDRLFWTKVSNCVQSLASLLTR